MRNIEKTKYPGIYLDKDTKTYTIKYNYTVYDPVEAKNKYKAKWVTGIGNITAAKLRLAELKAAGPNQEEADITLEGAHLLWLKKMKTENRSPVTISNNEQYMRMIYQFLSKDTKLKNITAEMYYDFCQRLRRHGYSEETLYSLNATFRKLITLAYKRRLINTNILEEADNMRTSLKDPLDTRLMPKDHYWAIDQYLTEHHFVRLGVDRYPLHRLAFAILWGCGLRLGELLALEWQDIRESPAPTDMEAYLHVNVTKAYVSEIKLTKAPKNIKKRAVVLPSHPTALFKELLARHVEEGRPISAKIFNWSHGASDSVLKHVCKDLGLPPYHCHEFRHAYCSYLIHANVPLPIIAKMTGDTVETLIKRYIHPVPRDEMLVVAAIDRLR